MPSLDAVPKKFALVGIQEGKKGEKRKKKSKWSAQQAETHTEKVAAQRSEV